MNILFITATRLGDAVLSTCVLDYFIKKYPGSKITVACGPIAAGIFMHAPGVVRVIPVPKKKYGLHWLRLAREVAWRKWDVVIDLRDSILSRVLWTQQRYIWRRSDSQKHKVQQMAALLGAENAPSFAPMLWLDEKTQHAAECFVPDGENVIAVGPTAQAAKKMWPWKHFQLLLEKLTAADGPFPGARIAVIAAPGEEDAAQSLLASFPSERCIDVIGKVDPLTAGAIVQKCRLYVGNDSGLMHMAAAVGVPTLGLFGPTSPQLYSPWGRHTAYVTTPESMEQLRVKFGAGKIKVSMMESLSVDSAYDAVLKLLAR